MAARRSPPPAPAFAPRPGFGSHGAPTKVFANHFLVKFSESSDPKVLFHYDVTIEPEPPRGRHRDILQQAYDVYGKEKLAGSIPAYDGQKALYTARELPEHVEMQVEFVDKENDGNRRRNRVFKVTLRQVSRLDLRLLQEFLEGIRPTCPQECLQVLDIVLREAAMMKRFVPRGRSFFGDSFGQTSLGGGVLAYNGFYQSIRPAQNGYLTLNLDIAAAPFIAPVLVTDFLADALGMDRRDLNLELARPDARGDALRVKAKKLLKGLRVETEHNPEAKRKYRIQSITRQPLRELTFDMNGETMSVVDYFTRTYNYRIVFQGLPALECGAKEKKRYLPMEVCKIVKGQPYLKMVNETQKKGLLGATCVPTGERMSKTWRIASGLIENSRNITKEFGVMVNRLLTEIPARILPSPRISYRSMDEMPRDGVWNMRQKVMLKGCRIKSWSVINFAHSLSDYDVNNFCRRLPWECETYGLEMNPDMAVGWIRAERYGNVENAIKSLYQRCMEITGEELQFLLCIMPQIDNKSIYASVKRICEIELGLVTQCCLSEHIKACHPQYIANLLLKVNVKLGGCNALLLDEKNRRLPLISSVPSIIFGADVSHPKVGDDYSPSICAVTASMDWPFFSQYETIVQSQRQRAEILEELFWEREDEQGRRQTGGIVKDLLRSFEQRSGQKPERIIFYRDGVSEGQFEAVLSHEMEAVKKACESLGWGNQIQDGRGEVPQQKRLRGESSPKITFIVVQKQHHTRFFPKDPQDKNHASKNGNILSGTVVDSVICHPNHFDFFLCSHNGLKGTSRPAHYYVLKDENNFGVDEIQRLTNDLCFTYARCTRAVSIVPPCHYAHLAAKRASVWLGSNGSDYESHPERASTVGSGGSRPTYSRIGSLSRPLPPLHDRIRGSMFYI